MIYIAFSYYIGYFQYVELYFRGEPMATIIKRVSKNQTASYLVRIRVKGHPPVSATFRRLVDARRWAHAKETEVHKNKHSLSADALRKTVTDATVRYSRTHLLFLKNTVDRRMQLKWWCARIGETLLCQVTPPMIAELRDELAEDRAPATVNRYLAALSRIFSLARTDWGWADRNPCQGVRRLKEPRGRVRFLSEDECQQLLEACLNRSRDLYLAVVLALSTGARKMEIWGLRWSQVDFQHKRIILTETKTGEIRSLSLQDHALELMRERSRVRRLDTDLVFPSRNPQKPFNLRAHWVAALSRTEIADFRWHDLRHTAASYFAMSGATDRELQEFGGWKSPEMVRRYAHLMEQHMAGKVAKMNRKMFKRGAGNGR